MGRRTILENFLSLKVKMFFSGQITSLDHFNNTDIIFQELKRRQLNRFWNFFYSQKVFITLFEPYFSYHSMVCTIRIVSFVDKQLSHDNPSYQKHVGVPPTFKRVYPHGPGNSFEPVFPLICVPSNLYPTYQPKCRVHTIG